MMDFDIIIIGSGAGGGTAAYALAEKGFRVGLIERGQHFNPKVDYVQNYADWENRSNPLENAMLNELTIDKSYRSSTVIDGRSQIRSPFNYHRVHGVGGSTLHYQGEAHRFAEHAFASESLFGWGADWPISYKDLEPYYQQIEQLLGVAGQVGNPFKPERGAFPTPAHPLSQKSQVLAIAARKVGMTLQNNTLALPSKSVDGRLPCQHSGGCNYGCVFGAKSSVDQALLAKFKKSSQLSILTDTQVTRLKYSESGEVVGVECSADNKGRIILSAKVYVLAAGAIETPRLMLNSKSDIHLAGFANEMDQVGRYFMETIVSWLPIQLKGIKQAYLGPPLDSRIWDYCYPADENTNGFVLGADAYLTKDTGPVSHAVSQPGIGRAHKRQVRESFGRKVSLFGIAEQQPVASNRITLSKQVDMAGVPKVKIHSLYSQQDHHTVQTMQAKLLAWADAAETDNTGQMANTLWQSEATHIAGTCRMGNDPMHSVTDQWGQVHNHDNVYITDASVMTTQGAGDSPSLTIQALALRTVDKIINDLKR